MESRDVVNTHTYTHAHIYTNTYTETRGLAHIHIRGYRGVFQRPGARDATSQEEVLVDTRCSMLAVRQTGIGRHTVGRPWEHAFHWTPVLTRQQHQQHRRASPKRNNKTRLSLLSPRGYFASPSSRRLFLAGMFSRSAANPRALAADAAPASARARARRYRSGRAARWGARFPSRTGRKPRAEETAERAPFISYRR